MLSKLGVHRFGFIPTSQLPCFAVVVVIFLFGLPVFCVYCSPPHVLKIAAQSPWFEMLIKMGLASGYNLYIFLQAKEYVK